MPPNWVGQSQPGHDANIPAGESGRLLEVRAFGGTLEFFNTPQVSYIMKSTQYVGLV